jgi:hypothetical protein
MKSTPGIIGMTVAFVIAASGLAIAGTSVGGHDETSESSTYWTVATVSPGTCSGGSAAHLLISEVTVTPTAGEFIEVCNPTGQSVDLSDFCLSDDWFAGGGPSGYFQRPSASYSLGTVTTDFNVCFPSGPIIPAGGVLTIAVSATGFNSTYGFNPDFEIRDDDGAVPTMTDVGGNSASFSTALLTNSSEFVVLYCWDGQSDLVCDVDYVSWGDITSSGNQVDKTGLSVDGPDGDVVASTYNNDTPIASQVRLPSPGAGDSLQRTECTEATEASDGNGCTVGTVSVQESTWGLIKTRYR